MLLYELIRHIDFFDEDSISANALKQAWELVKDVDQKDLLFVALPLELNGLLWTGDTKLRTGLESKGFSSFFSIVQMRVNLNRLIAYAIKKIGTHFKQSIKMPA